MNLELIIALTGLAAVMLSASAVVVSLKGIRDQLWLSTFATYTARYSEVMEDIPFEARDPRISFNIDKLPIQEREKVLGAVRKYANLCSEELYLHQVGRIDKKTWFIWKTGMRDTMRTSCFRRGWELVRGEYEYYPGFREMMDAFVAEGSADRLRA